jgi:hypothetical protein
MAASHQKGQFNRKGGFIAGFLTSVPAHQPSAWTAMISSSIISTHKLSDINHPFRCCGLFSVLFMLGHSLARYAQKWQQPDPTYVA